MSSYLEKHERTWDNGAVSRCAINGLCAVIRASSDTGSIRLWMGTANNGNEQLWESPIKSVYQLAHLFTSVSSGHNSMNTSKTYCHRRLTDKLGKSASIDRLPRFFLLSIFTPSGSYGHKLFLTVYSPNLNLRFLVGAARIRCSLARGVFFYAI